MFFCRMCIVCLIRVAQLSRLMSTIDTITLGFGAIFHQPTDEVWHQSHLLQLEVLIEPAIFLWSSYYSFHWMCIREKCSSLDGYRKNMLFSIYPHLLQLFNIIYILYQSIKKLDFFSKISRSAFFTPCVSFSRYYFTAFGCRRKIFFPFNLFMLYSCIDILILKFINLF